jgi:ribosome-associated toxin RatA of RatAB toxin-antitoxin module
MEHAEHTVTIAASIDTVWDLLVDVEGYARFFPPTEKVEIIEEAENVQIARFFVDLNGSISSWVSRRDLDPVHRVIAYRQVETAPIVASMGGEWRAFPLRDSATQLVLTHDFSPRATPDGTVSLAEADTMLRAVVERNSVADLGAVKSEAERMVARVSAA